jgi:hypothetical protein
MEKITHRLDDVTVLSVVKYGSFVTLGWFVGLRLYVIQAEGLRGNESICLFFC